jgi:phosphopantothenate-cysteine ligase/phosphopantothenoylcysteine decarboxylase/phosphopantothenate--cysteine ligase
VSLRVLVTAGSTQVPIDRVRAITNVFTGRTGTQVAAAIAALPGTSVRLLTSAPHRVREWGLPDGVEVSGFTTFDELRGLMQSTIERERWPDAIVHSAAVSDYLVEGVADASGRALDAGGKIASEHERLVIRLVKAPKLVDLIRVPWGFAGTLVKFKLTVDRTDAELEAIARASMRHSRADAIVANDLAWAHERAMVLQGDHAAEHVQRALLAPRVARLVRDAGIPG